MTRRMCTGGLILAILAFFVLSVRSADNQINIPFTTRGLTTTIGLELQTNGASFSVSQTSKSKIYTNGQYQIQITETATSKQRSILRVQASLLSGQPFSVNSLSITVPVPSGNLAGIWFPSQLAGSTSLMAGNATQAVGGFATANYGVPYIAAADSSGNCSFAVGLGRQDLSVYIAGSPVSNGTYQFQLSSTVPWTTSSLDESIYISTGNSMTWFDSAGDYSDWVDGLMNYTPFPVSSRAYDPLYDTWYWTGDNVNQDTYINTAMAASSVGINNYVADSGWDTATGEYAKWLQGSTGNYRPAPAQFPDIQETFNEMRTQFQMGVTLWLQPFAVGQTSFRYPNTSNLHMQIPQNFSAWWAWWGYDVFPAVLPLEQNLETVNLCPQVAATATYIKNLFNDVFAKYNPQGYWIDFVDGLAAEFCVASHTHDYATFGAGLRASLDAMKTTILANDPNSVVHFRAHFANLNNKTYASVFQSGDAPNDYDQMRLEAMRMRPFSKGAVFASDQVYWPNGSTDSWVAQTVMTSVMTGVPAFAGEFMNSASQTEILTNWIQFYRDHQTDLTQGDFIPYGSITMPNHKIEGQNGTYAYIRTLDSTDLTAQSPVIYLMNATGAPTMNLNVDLPAGSTANYSAQVFDCYLNPQPGLIEMPVVNGQLILNMQIDEGGVIVLRPFDPANSLPTGKKPGSAALSQLPRLAFQGN